MTDRQQTNYYEVLGIDHHGNLIMLDYIFDHGRWFDGRRFKGATGSSFDPISQAFIDDFDSDEAVIEWYQDAGYKFDAREPDRTYYEYYDDDLGGYIFDEESYNQALEDYRQDLAAEVDRLRDEYEYYPGYDGSYTEYLDDDLVQRFFPGAVAMNCHGGGRMFPDACLNLKVCLRPDLVTLILNAEHVCKIYEV